MKTVLGLSVTSHGIAWALVGGGDRPADVTPLDDDAFDVDAADQLTARAAAAARSARAIATSSGQDVAAIGVTWHGPDPDDFGDRLAELLDLLAEAGFDDVRVVAEEAAADDLHEADAQVRDAQDAARAVATNAVAARSRPVRHRPPAPCKHRAVRVVAAAAATVAAGMLTVSSQFTEPAPIPAGDEADVTAAAAPAPRLVTVAAPRLSERAVTMLPTEEPTPVQFVEAAPIVAEEPAEPVVAAHVTPVEPVAPVQRTQPVAVVQTVVPQAVPVVQMAVPAQLPGGVPAATLPAAQPHLPAAEAHIATDPSPGPALAPSGPAPAAAPVPASVPVSAPVPATPADPISGWLLAAMP
ncbi:hypothetical protein [Mycolicibacterium neworleansense]|uniref:FHA domain-containing protein n=1 Tax=Mycolicibacterium neworleansense TaxID=146018 RepID=A0A0H5RJ77_9MYCO|nr:hypothetical protein [Mycolicibacterium neworleansense]MCV7361764.1 hypothetical protein [Mycolicibacterium neworleansense]CRZ14068.1 FHA domain-containing protein [Mycolicibacterium neworleansense]